MLTGRGNMYTEFGTFMAFPILILAVFLISQPGYSDVEEYIEPRIDGYRLDACLTFSKTCHEPAANRWCTDNSYSRSIYWEISDDIGHIDPTKTLVGKEVCDKAYCHAFDTIVCYKPNTKNHESDHSPRSITPDADS